MFGNHAQAVLFGGEIGIGDISPSTEGGGLTALLQRARAENARREAKFAPPPRKLEALDVVAVDLTGEATVTKAPAEAATAAPAAVEAPEAVKPPEPAPCAEACTLLDRGRATRAEALRAAHAAARRAPSWKAMPSFCRGALPSNVTTTWRGGRKPPASIRLRYPGGQIPMNELPPNPRSGPEVVRFTRTSGGGIKRVS